MKNLKDKVALAYESEVDKLKAAGWKLLDAAEEEAIRLKLKAEPELTSAVSTEAARVEAGVQEALAGDPSEASATTDSKTATKTKGSK
jgi:hypothetical protein